MSRSKQGTEQGADGSFQVLRNRNFALLWSAGLVSAIGSWMQTVAVAALITELTDQAFWGGLVGAVAYISSGFITPFGGVLADRVDRRRLIIWAASAEAVLAVGLAGLFLADAASPVVLTLVTALEGVLLALSLPARQAMLPDIVPRAQIAAATSLSFASHNLGRIVGPALGGVFIAVGSYAWVFTFNAVTYVFVALAALALRLPVNKIAAVTTSVLTRMREGYRGARNQPECWAAIRMIAVMAVLVSPFIALVPAMAQIELGGDAVDTAHLVTGQGAGAVAGALLFPVLIKRFGRNRVVLTNLFVLPITAIAYALAPNFPVAIAALTLLGMSYIAVLSGLSATMQTFAPAEVRARAIAVFMTTLNFAYPIGAASQGWLSDQFGLRPTLSLGAAAFSVFLVYLAAAKPDVLRALSSEAPNEDNPVSPQKAS